MKLIQKSGPDENHTALAAWSGSEKIAFRFAFIFIILLVVPLEWDWYERLFSSGSFYDFMATLAGGSKSELIKIETESGRWGLASYASWGLAALIALLGATIWTILSGSCRLKQYGVWYYWLRVLVRYRIGIGLIAFGFIKFYPMQMPFPSVANLNTDFGDYAAFKLYWQLVGVSYRYEIFLGFLEIAAGVLFFFRATTALGAIITAGLLFNITHANFGYDGGVHVYASYFVLLSLFLLVQYVPDLWKLFIRGESVKSAYYYPDFSKTWLKYLYYSWKTAFIVSFVFIYGSYRYHRFYNEGRLKEPILPGLEAAAGHYTVSTFVHNGDTLRYSPRDSVRWHDVTFERYSTLAYRVNMPLPIALSNGVPSVADVLKEYELTGRAGGRVYLYYEINAPENELYLLDKNQRFSRELDRQFDTDTRINLKGLYETGLRDSLNILRWHYERPTYDRIILSGLDVDKDSIVVVLDRIDELYLTGKEWYMENNLYTYP